MKPDTTPGAAKKNRLGKGNSLIASSRPEILHASGRRKPNKAER